MMKRFALVLMALCLMAATGLNPECSQTSARPYASFRVDPEPDSTDILQEVLAMHKALPAPSKEFRKGHISPRAIEKYLKAKEGGFAIQLPHHGLTPSPTIYKGIAYLSGGFGSKQFYAFNAKTGEKIWAVDLDDDGPSSAVVEDDIVVFNTESCTIFALQARTGELLWSYWLGDPLMSTPTILDGKVFTAYPATRGGYGGFGGPGSYGGYGNLNQVKQMAIPPDQIQETETTGVDSVNTYSGKLRATHVLIAFDLKSGEILWQKWIDGDIMSAPVGEKDALYVTTFPGTLYKFNPDNGEVLAANASRATSAPVIVGEDILMSQRTDHDVNYISEALTVKSATNARTRSVAYQKSAPYLDKKVQNASGLKAQAMEYDAGNGFGDGAPANSGWEAASDNIGQSNVSSLQAYQGSRVLHHNGYNYSTMGDEIVCTSADGDVLWKKPVHGNLEQVGGTLATPPLTVDGKLIYATYQGKIIIADASTGEEIQVYDVGENIRYQPVVDNGNIYVTTMQGKMHCIETGNKKLTGWPTWGANAAHTNKIAD